MPDNDRLNFVACLEPGESTVEWYKDLLYCLWQHGLSFSPHWQKVFSWEDELAYQPERFVPGTTYRYPEARSQLPQWFEGAAIAGSGSLYAYDKGLRLFLTLQPGAGHPSAGPDPRTKLGRIKITYNRVFLNPDHSPTEDLLPFYLQAWFAHIHWAEVCCTQFSPLYALSYQQRDMIYQEPHTPGYDQSIVDPRLMMLERVAKTYPIQVPRLSQTRLQYFSPQLLTHEEELSLLRLPHQFSEYLPTGGLLVIPRADPFHYGYGIAYNLFNRSRKVENNDAEATMLVERGNEIMAVYSGMLDHK